MNKNIMRPYKYYLTDDLIYLYIINTDTNKIDRLYELKKEDFVEYTSKTDYFDDLSITITNKNNDKHTYIIKDGKRVLADKDDFPYITVTRMIRIDNIKDIDSYLDNYYANKSDEYPKTYNKNTMNEFIEKYGKYYEK